MHACIRNGFNGAAGVLSPFGWIDDDDDDGCEDLM
jgi:hypothetical protein